MGPLSFEELVKFAEHDNVLYRSDAVRKRLDQIAALAERGQEMAIGDVRLVAWLEEELPGVTFEPVAAQARHAALLVAHLQYGPLSLPQADKNTRADVREMPKDDDDVTTTFEALPEDAKQSTEIPDPR